jgi:hypothetical protein
MKPAHKIIQSDYDCNSSCFDLGNSGKMMTHLPTLYAIRDRSRLFKLQLADQVWLQVKPEQHYFLK